MAITKIIKKLKFKFLKTILFEKEILISVFGYLENKQFTWAARGATPVPLGHYFEFGCYDGDTLIDFLKVRNFFYEGQSLGNKWKVFAFDSFEGLPEPEGLRDSHPFASKGSYKSRGETLLLERIEKEGFSLDEIKTYKGFFEDSLTKELRDGLISEGIVASFVNIDCDYYSSTKTVLDWLEPLLQPGSVVYFDDVYFYDCNPNKGELLAITEFNSSRKGKAGLALAPILDRGHRCYLYWTNEDYDVSEFEFKQYVSG